MSDEDKKSKDLKPKDAADVSLENSFYKLALEKKIRQTFRVPVAEGDNVKVIINDIEYDVADIATKGIGIRITKLDKFEVGQTIKPLRIIILDKTFRLEGKIVHITPDGPDTSTCGIEFTNLPVGSRDMMLNYLKKYGSFDMNTVF